MQKEINTAREKYQRVRPMAREIAKLAQVSLSYTRQILDGSRLGNSQRAKAVLTIADRILQTLNT